MPGTGSGLEDAIALITRIASYADDLVDLRFSQEAFQGRTPAKEEEEMRKKEKEIHLHHQRNAKAFEREKETLKKGEILILLCSSFDDSFANKVQSEV